MGDDRDRLDWAEGDSDGLRQRRGADVNQGGRLGRMMPTELGTGPSNILLLLAVVALLVLVGSFVYWLGEGSPGTPDEFRDRVADTGLEVRWANNGPRGGDGVVETYCGPVDVTVSELDGQLHVSVPPEAMVPLDAQAVAEIVSCRG